jgi:flagellar basal body rod protein FlgF
MIIEAPDSRPSITEALTGRTIDYVIRGDHSITLCTVCGREISLESDKDGNIQLKNVGVKIKLQGLSLFGDQGKL